MQRAPTGICCQAPLTTLKHIRPSVQSRYKGSFIDSNKFVGRKKSIPGSAEGIQPFRSSLVGVLTAFFMREKSRTRGRKQLTAVFIIE
jgi:hypothetical protein